MKAASCTAWADALERAAAAAPPPVPTTPKTEIDPEADPLTIARGLLQRHVEDMGALKADSPRLNQAKGEARQLTKLIQAIERQVAKEETPAQAEERKRREDGETRREMLEYVEQAEREAARPREDAPFGVCVRCEAPLRAPPDLPPAPHE